MKVVSLDPGHNTTVCYFEDGECKKVIQEEKFSNLKNHTGFPFEGLRYLSKLYDFRAVDYFIFSSVAAMWLSVPDKKSGTTYAQGNFIEDLSRSWIRKYLEYKIHPKKLLFHLRNFLLYQKITPQARREFSKYFHETYGVGEEKLKYFDHHTCHALSPLYFYNLENRKEDILLITMDGAGDNSFSKVFIYHHKNRSYEEIANSRHDASLGLLYSETTKFLGMKPNEHEYKVMGLAAYVTDFKYYRHIYEKLKTLIWFDKKTLTFDSKFNMYVSVHFLKDNFQCERFDNISAALQRLIEELVIELVKAAIAKTGIRTIAVSGGVFMNVKLNQKIQGLPEVKKIYFMPSSGDESTVIGAAYKLYLDKKLKTHSDESMYKGFAYSNEDVLNFLQKNKNKYIFRYYKNVELEIAKLLAKHRVVARFKGAGEWGARSLCNRCILGNASDLSAYYEINDAIKMRDFWMPFAPTIMEDWAGRYIRNWSVLKNKVFESSKYMITAFDTTPLAEKHLRAAIHQKDKTIRPQILSLSDNPEMYKLLKHYEKFTGMGGLLNTSLNLHGFPLVGTLEQALFTFDNSKLTYIAIENYLVTKK